MAYQSKHTGTTIDNAIDQVAQLLNIFYPVGSIYTSTKSTSPATLFGGTWVQIKDTFLLTAGDSYSAGSQGGSATHTHTSAAHTHTTAGHTLTIDQIPAHTGHIDPDARPSDVEHGNPNNSAYLDCSRNITGYTSSGNGYNYGWVVVHGNEAYPAAESHGGGASHSHGNTGSTTPGNTGSSSNLPPYKVVYAWERTA